MAAIKSELKTCEAHIQNHNGPKYKEERDNLETFMSRATMEAIYARLQQMKATIAVQSTCVETAFASRDDAQAWHQNQKDKQSFLVTI